MPTYITLGNYTQQGMENMKDSPGRLARAREAFRAAGAELQAFYLVMGRYDFVAISEVPDDQTVARLALALGAQGNIRTETLRAFDEDELGTIIARLP